MNNVKNPSHKNPIKKQFPETIWNVFLCSSFFIFSWSTIIFLYDIPGLILRLPVGEIIGHLAYLYTLALFESLLLTIVSLVVGFLLSQPKPNKNTTILASLFIFYLSFSQILFQLKSSIATYLSKFTISENRVLIYQIIVGIWLFTFILSPLLAYTTAKNNRISRMVENFLDRLPPLISIYIFLAIIGTIIVVVRNIS